jgi:teichuronic acid biosynthesis glycosyltransferase TuaC
VKILSFSYCFPNHKSPTWGVFVYQRLLALAGLAGVELEVAAPVPHFPVLTRLRGGAGPQRENWRGLRVHRPRFLYVPGMLKSLDARLYARGLRGWLGRRIERWRPDALDAHFVWPDGVGVSLLAGQFGLPYVITLRGKIYPCLEIPSQRRQCAEALRGAAAVVSVDSRMARVARELGAPAERVHVIPNGVDRVLFRPLDRLAARRQLGLPETGRLLVTVAHLGPRKGHRETIEALSRLPGDVRLVLVGGERRPGKDERALRRLAASLGVEDRVLLVGQQSYERIPLYFAAADLSVLASWREGCPNVVLESLAAGTPVVASDVGAVADLIIEERNGRVVPPRQVEPLAEAIAHTLEVPPPRQQVRNSPSVRSWDDVAEDVRQVLQTAARASQRTVRNEGGQPIGRRSSFETAQAETASRAEA